MYVWGRYLRVKATARSRGPLRIDEASSLSFRVLPGDVDQYRHMNNARYNMVTDLGRMDIFRRSGLWRLRRTHDWGPMLDGSEMAFVRELRLWTQFDLISTMDCWRGRHFLARHRFVHRDGRTAALMLGAVGIYDFTNRRFIEIDRVVETLGQDIASRPPEREEGAFLESHAGLRAFAKRLAGPGQER